MRLDGVRVLDLTRLLPGPYATQLLADMGADVVKVEEPGRGDYARALDDGTGVFQAVNRGKRSIALDLASADGRSAFHRLAAKADVIVEAFRPGVAADLNVGYEDVREVNPGIVYCSLTGFGATGPNRDRVGHDLNYVAMAGLLDMTRTDPDARPVIPGYPVADMAGGLFATVAILGGLLSRALGDGSGDHLDVAMTDVVLSLSQAVAGQALSGGDPRPGETALTGELPSYAVYETADEEYVTLAALEPQFFEAFCAAVDRPELVEHHMTPDPDERAALREALADVFRSKTRDEWEAALEDVEATVAPVLSPAEALDSQQTRERGLLDESGDVPRVGFPARSSSDTPATGGPVPDLGEHTAEVLRELGLDEDEIRTLGSEREE